MKHFSSPQSKTLGLVIGTALLLLLAGFLILQINEAYIRDEGGWVDKQIQKSSSKQVAVLKTTDGDLVRGDVRRSLTGKRALLTVEVADVTEPGGDSYYSLYFTKKDQPDTTLFIAQLGAPQQIEGTQKYILTGWGPEDWFDYDTVELRLEGSSSKSKLVLAGTFAADR